MSKSNGIALRFAALVRVSGEAQEKWGESLGTQSKQITSAVENMSGEVVAWYKGQEHATPGYERKLLEAMLRDAAKKRKPFDAVMVADPTRWSRDNERSDSGLNHLRQHGIRFFVLGMEFSLYDPIHRYMLQQFASFGELSAGLNLQKSIQNRIERAKANVPTAGKLPCGRTFDKRTGKWGIDKAEQRRIQDIAERYINGEPLKLLAKENQTSRSRLFDTLMYRCGTEWPVHFRCERLNIDTTITLTVPRLLPSKTIKAVQQRANSNRTCAHGHIRHKHLLARMIFCGHCGSTLSGALKATGRRYYKHWDDIGNCLGGAVRADQIEESVMRQLFETFGNPAAVQRAIEAATPNLERIEQQRERRERVADELEAELKGRERIISFIRKGTIDEDDAEKELKASKEREELLRDELDKLDDSLATAPDRKTARRVAERLGKKFRKRRVPAEHVRLTVAKQIAETRYDRMTWDEKRALLQSVFSGTLREVEGLPHKRLGYRMGVYVYRIEGGTKYRPRDWTFAIRGNLIDSDGLTMGPEELVECFEDELSTRFGRTRPGGLIPARTGPTSI